MVKLYAREHFVAHKLLAKCTSGQSYYKMLKAIAAFCLNKNRKIKFTSRDYETLRISQKANTRTPEQNAHHSKLMLGVKKTPEHAAKISKGLTGLKKTPEHLANLSKVLTGQIRTPEQNEINRLAHLGYKYKIVVCPHCGLEGGLTGMNNHHFEKCKYHPNKILNVLSEVETEYNNKLSKSRNMVNIGAGLLRELNKIRSILIFQKFPQLKF